MGERLAAEIRKQSKPFQHADVLPYVTRVARELSAQLPKPPAEFIVECISGSDFKEPVVYRPGYLFVPQAVLVRATDEAAFIQVLAHSIGHLAVEPIESRGSSIPIRWVELHQQPNAPALIPMALRERQQQSEVEADRHAENLIRRAVIDSPEEFQRAKTAAMEAMPKRRPPTLRR